jgi:hypothetical protein
MFPPIAMFSLNGVVMRAARGPSCLSEAKDEETRTPSVSGVKIISQKSFPQPTLKTA